LLPKFTLSVPAGNTYVMVAKASRSVGDDTEYYNWIVPVDLTTANDGLTVMLSNDNLVETVDGLSVNTNLIPDSVPNVDVVDIKSEATSYTFKDSNDNDVTPDAPSTDNSTVDATTSTPAAPSIPAWTPPDPLPAKDSWTWTVADKTYSNVVVTGCNTDDGTVSITHSLGVAHLPVSTLPADIQKALNYQDPNAPPAPPAPFDTSITKVAPLEAYASDGSMTGVSQSTIGQKFKCLRTEDGKAVLQDATGNIFKIEADAIAASQNK
jgi:hypothetical protein